MKIFTTVIVTLAALVVLGLLFIYSGVYNVAATKPHTPLVNWALSTTTDRSVEAHAPKSSAITIKPDPAAGARKFAAMCVTCHGGPQQKRWPPAEHMTPRPPELKEAGEEMSLGELVWIVQHGVKMTAMPGFGPIASEEEIVHVASFVDTLPQINDAQYRQWLQPKAEPDTTGDTLSE